MFKYDVWGWYSQYIKKDILKNIKPRVARLIIPVLVSEILIFQIIFDLKVSQQAIKNKMPLAGFHVLG